MFHKGLSILTVLILATSSLTAFAGETKDAAEESAAEFYDPVIQKVEGWTIKLDPQLLLPENAEIKGQALTAIANHLQRVKFIVDKPHVKQLQQLPIWVELENATLTSMQYHPDRGWLISNGHDPRLVKHVHVPIARELYARHMWAKHPYVLLHELAHAYHDQVLSFDNKEIIAAFKKAQAEKIYDKVLDHNGRNVKHYGIGNHKEYFAESTEAYFGVNDFYPFVRAELKTHDPGMFRILETVWGKIQ